MKKVLLTTTLLLVMGLQLCFAQKSQPSDYNLRKAYELFEQNDEKEAMKLVAKDRSISKSIVYQEIFGKNK